MLPLIAGFLVAGPVSGYLSDRYGARPFATGGMVAAAVSFLLLELLPVDFSYVAFAPLLLLNGLAMGLFSSPNRAAIMNSLPADQRGAGAGMSATFQNTAAVLSIGIFFSLMIVGLAASLPARCTTASSPTACPAPTRPASRTCRPWRRSSPRSSATTRCSTCSGRTSSPPCPPRRRRPSPAAPSSRR